MPTDVISSIGSGVGRDYSTVQAWEAACPSNLVTADQRWIGEMYDDGELTASGTILAIAGTTTDSTRNIILRAASGASFKDKSGVRSSALKYDATKGVAIRSTNSYTTAVTCSVNHTQVIGIQISATGTGSIAWEDSAGSNTGGRISQCILASSGGGQGCRISGKITNSLLTFTRASGDGIYLNGTGASAHGCTIVNTTGSSGNVISTFSYGSTVVKNTAGFGFTGFGGGGSTTGTNNATDVSSISFGSSHQTSLVFANQFVNSANDFRAIATGSLDANGTPDATNLTTDIAGLTRGVSTPTIGCWEVPGGSFVISPSAIPANHSEPITLTLTGTGTSWDGSTVFVLSGVSGVNLVSQQVLSATSAEIVVTTE